MEYRNIHTFLRVAELQSFTQAAASLGYSQSTITFHIQSLEEELGISLFDRIGKKVTLTEAGEKLIGYANQMLRLEAEMKEIGRPSSELTGTLRIGTVESLLASYGVRAISRYHKKHPKIAVDIQTASSLELMDRLRSNDVDLIMIMGPKALDPGFVRTVFQPEPLSFITYTGHPLLEKAHLTLADMMEQPLILPEKKSLYRRAAEEVAARSDLVLSPAIQVSNTVTILSLLKEKMGVSFLPDYLTGPEVQAGALSILPVEDLDAPQYYLEILHHRNKWLTPQMESFIEIMRELLD